tara:strand:- start:24 stop:203 length:180 start_codon:yes stop_codon:yes gene_type:complete
MISVYDITFYKYDEDGVEVLNEDGTLKLFTLNHNNRSSQSIISEINELIEDDDVEEKIE